MRPTISICIVVLNAAAELRSTLESIHRQEYWLKKLSFEIIIIDGNSTDSTLIVAEEWKQRCDFNVWIHSQAPRGIYPAMNEALSNAQGRWLVFINAGDMLLDGEPLFNALHKGIEEGIRSIQFQSAMFIPGASRGIWIPGLYPACHQALVYQRELHELYGPYDERFNVCADRIFDQHIYTYGRQLYPGILSATQVGPANRSRNPNLLRRDLQKIRELNIPFKLASPPWLTFLVLRLEKTFGISFSVWIRLWLRILVGRAQWVSLQ